MVRRRQVVRRPVRNSRGTGNVARIVRAARNAPLARVRARPTVRGRGSSSANINALRMLKMFPKKIKTNGTLDTKWWIETLKWFGGVAMKILSIALTSEDLEKFLVRYPLPAGHPLSGQLLEGSIPTGSIMKLAFGPEDFLGETDFVDSSLTPARGHYRQARLEWIKVVINPTADTSNRGGMIAAALYAVNVDQMKDDFGVRANEAHDMKEILATPGVVYKTASTPTTLSYSPRPGEHAYQWLQFGCQDVKTGKYGAGGDVCVYLDIAYQDMATDDTNQSKIYSLSHCLLDVNIEARVHLREYDEGVYVRTGPIPLSNAEKISIRDYNRSLSVPLSEVQYHHGVLLYPATVDMSIE